MASKRSAKKTTKSKSRGARAARAVLKRKTLAKLGRFKARNVEVGTPVTLSGKAAHRLAEKVIAENKRRTGKHPALVAPLGEVVHTTTILDSIANAAGVPVETLKGDVEAAKFDAGTESPALNLKLRQPRYGKFYDRARIAQSIQQAMQNRTNWESLEDDQRQGLQMIAEKASRILNGDPDHYDSWDDLAAYARLVSERLQGRGV